MITQFDYIDYNKREYLPDKKNPIVTKTCFSEEKLMKQFGNPSLSRGLPPRYLSKFQKQERPPPLNCRGEETMRIHIMGKLNLFQLSVAFHIETSHLL